MTTRSTLDRYLNFISKRASGENKTNARWIREFISSHPKYNCDSVVTEEINYDLLVELDKIAKGKLK